MSKKHLITDKELTDMIIEIELWLKKIKAKIKEYELQNKEKTDKNEYKHKDEYKHKYSNDKQEEIRAGCLVTHNQSIMNWQKSLRNY